MPGTPPAREQVAAGYTLVDAPWGPVHVAASERGVIALEVLTSTDGFIARLQRRAHGTVSRDRLPSSTRCVLDDAAGKLASYLEGSGDLDLPIDLTGVTDWDRRVLLAVRTVPYGRVTSYGRVARMVGSPGAARAVGSAVGRNPIGLVIPCHRVIAGNGTLGGYGGDWSGSRDLMLDIKSELLRREGVSLPQTALFGP